MYTFLIYGLCGKLCIFHASKFLAAKNNVGWNLILLLELKILKRIIVALKFFDLMEINLILI